MEAVEEKSIQIIQHNLPPDETAILVPQLLLLRHSFSITPVTIVSSDPVPAEILF
jgi:hypothetical protein